MQKDPENPGSDERTPGVPPHEPQAPEGDDAVDEEAKESFPSSDPPSTGSPGI